MLVRCRLSCAFPVIPQDRCEPSTPLVWPVDEKEVLHRTSSLCDLESHRSPSTIHGPHCISSCAGAAPCNTCTWRATWHCEHSLQQMTFNTAFVSWMPAFWATCSRKGMSKRMHWPQSVTAAKRYQRMAVFVLVPGSKY